MKLKYRFVSDSHPFIIFYHNSKGLILQVLLLFQSRNIIVVIKKEGF